MYRGTDHNVREAASKKWMWFYFFILLCDEGRLVKGHSKIQILLTTTNT